MSTPIQSRPGANFFSSNETVALTVGTASTNVSMGNLNSDWLSAVFTNVGSNVLYINLGTDNTVAAAIPIAGTPAHGYPLLPNSSQTLHIGNASYVAAIAAATGNTLFVTVGT